MKESSDVVEPPASLGGGGGGAVSGISGGVSFRGDFCCCESRKCRYSWRV